MISTDRFAFVTPKFHPRTCGVGDFSMRLGEELQRRGAEVRIFSRNPADVHPEGRTVGVTGADGATPLIVAARLWPAIVAFRPTHLVLQYTPQMLGASRFGSPATLWLAQAARRAGVEVILMAHELFLPWGNRLDLAVGAALMRAQLALLMKTSNRVIVTMETRIKEVAPLARLIRLGRHVGVVRIGTAALPLPRVARQGRLRLGVFSTLASTKRLDVVLDAFAAVHASRAEAELVVLGDLGSSNDPRVRAVHDAIARHPGRERIRVPGKLPLGEVAREVAEMDVYFFPMISGANTRTSTLPLALGAGVPVVATRSYETDPLFVGDQNIVFADAMTGEAFGRAALRLVANPQLADSVAAGARTLYEGHLSWQRIADQFIDRIRGDAKQ